MLYSRSFILMAVANMFTMASMSSFFLLPLFITRHGGTEADIGILMAVFTFASILSRPWISEMIDRIGRKRSYTIACIILVLTPLVYPVFQGTLSSFYFPMIWVRIVHGVGFALSFTSVITYISLFFIFYSAGAILMRLFGGRLADKVGEVRIIPYGFAVTGCGLLSIIPLNGIPILILSGFLAGSGHGLLYPCLNAMAIRDEPADIRGKIIGIFTGGLDTGIFIGSLILGYVGKWFGFQVLFLIAGLPLFMGLLIFRFQSKRFKKLTKTG